MRQAKASAQLLGSVPFRLFTPINQVGQGKVEYARSVSCIPVLQSEKRPRIKRTRWGKVYYRMHMDKEESIAFYDPAPRE